MGKKLRFPLKMEDEIEVRTLSELKDNFSLTKIFEYASNGKLITWLKDRFEDGIADAIEKLDSNCNEFPKQICEAFGINNVAFCQDDLYDLLDEQYDTIYLYGDKFEIPINKHNITYIGFNNPIVIINSEDKVNWEEKKIILSKVQFDDKYKKLLKNKEVTKVSMSQKAKDTMINTMINCITNQFGNNLITNNVINTIKPQAATSLKDVPDDKEITEDVIKGVGVDILNGLENKLGVKITEKDKKEFMELFLDKVVEQGSEKQKKKEESVPETTRNKNPSNDNINNNPITNIKPVKKKITEVPNNEIPETMSNQTSVYYDEIKNRTELEIDDHNDWFMAHNVGKYPILIYKEASFRCLSDPLLSAEDIKVSLYKMYDHIKEIENIFSQEPQIWYNLDDLKVAKRVNNCLSAEPYLVLENIDNFLGLNVNDIYDGRFATYKFNNGFKLIILLDRDIDDVIIQDNRQWYMDNYKWVD